MNDLRDMLLFVVLLIVLLPGRCFSADDHPGNAEPSVGSPLSVSGEVKEVRLHKEEAAGEMVIDVFMTVHFKNHGTSPLLVFVDKDWPWQGGESLSSSREDVFSRKYVYVSGAWPASDRADWEETLHRLDQKSPPMDLIRLIEPGKEWIFDKSVVLGIGIKGKLRQDQQTMGCDPKG